MPSCVAISSIVTERLPYRLNNSSAFCLIRSCISIIHNPCVYWGDKTKETFYVAKVSVQIFCRPSIFLYPKFDPWKMMERLKKFFRESHFGGKKSSNIFCMDY